MSIVLHSTCSHLNYALNISTKPKQDEMKLRYEDQKFKQFLTTRTCKSRHLLTIFAVVTNGERVLGTRLDHCVLYTMISHIVYLYFNRFYACLFDHIRQGKNHAQQNSVLVSIGFFSTISISRSVFE